jgi:hypothetical protein
MEENKNEEIIAYIKFYGEIKKVILSNTFDEFKLKLCKVLEINENLFNSLKLSYKDEDNDTISVSSEEDYNILIGQIKSKEVDIINIEKEGNANIDINACEKSILKFNEKLNKDEENEKEEIKINNKNLNIISNQQFEINNEENNNKKYNNIQKNEIIINNNIPNNKINNNLIIHNDNDLESPYIHYNNFNNNIQHNKNTINFNNLNYINNGNRNINLNNQTYMVFPYYCNLCNQYPIVKVLYYCLVCGIPLCQECEEKLGINHRHSILKVQTKQQYDDLQIKINGNSKEKVNIQNNNKDNSNQSGIQKIADNFTNTIKNSVLYLFGNDNKNENLNNIDNRGQIYNQPMIPQKMNLIQLARAKYDLDGISDNQLQEAIEKANGNIDDAIVLLMS